MFSTKLAAVITSFVFVLLLLFITMPQPAKAGYNMKEVGVYDMHSYNSRKSGRFCYNVYFYYAHNKPKPIKTNNHWNTYHASGGDSESHEPHSVSHLWVARKRYQFWLTTCPDEE